MKPLSTIYRGLRADTGCCWLVEEPGGPLRVLSLAPSLGLANHSPTGFEWGYGGSGPAQLALAILLDFTSNDAVALRHYQDFKWAHVAGWCGDTANVTGAVIAAFLLDQGVDQAALQRTEDHRA